MTEELTEREREVVKYLLCGYPYDQIARELDVMPFTVKYHVHNICRKWGTHSRREISAYAQQLGIRPEYGMPHSANEL